MSKEALSLQLKEKIYKIYKEQIPITIFINGTGTY